MGRQPWKKQVLSINNIKPISNQFVYLCSQCPYFDTDQSNPLHEMKVDCVLTSGSDSKLVNRTWERFSKVETA